MDTSNPQKILKQKIKNFVKQTDATSIKQIKNSENAMVISKVFFYIIGLFGIFVGLLHSLIIYMQLNSELSDRFRLLSRQFIFPVILFTSLCIASVIVMKCRCQIAACILALLCAFPQTLQLLQLASSEYQPSFSSVLITMYALMYILQISALIMLFVIKSNKRLVDKLYDAAIATIYGSGISSNEILNNKEFIEAVDNYEPNLKLFEKIKNKRD